MPDSIDALGLPRDLPETEPGVDRPREQLAWQLAWQSRACRAMGSPLYGLLLDAAAADVVAGGPCWEVLRGHVAPGRGDALALRFMAAVHRLALTGRAPALATYYPSVGGTAPADGAWAAFRDAVEEHAGALARDIARPCQTNEVGRAAGLVWGFLEVAAATGLPLALREIGASAGLNLRWDRFRYGGGGVAWGPPGSPVDLSGHWADPAPHTDVGVVVAERRGCDPHPVDPLTPQGRLAVSSSIWADQTDRFARLEGAVALAAEIPATVDAASAEDWLDAVLARPVPGAATVVYHSVVLEYLSERAGDRLRAAVEAAGARATAQAPVAWLRLEPATMLRGHAITLKLWPAGDERVLAVCGSHGTDVRRPPPPARRA